MAVCVGGRRGGGAIFAAIMIQERALPGQPVPTETINRPL